MKKYMELIVQFKFVWGLFFTASILIYSLVNMFLGNSSMDFIVIWQFVLITLILVLIHYLIFGEFILNSLSTKYKLIVHFILCYITILISVKSLKWIDISQINSLGIYTLAYTFFYSAISCSLYIYYKITGEKLNSKLAQYKQKNN